MILDALNSINDKRNGDTQPQIINANIQALGSSSTRYAIQRKPGGVLSNISGPSGLNIGESVVVSVYPGKTKKYVILGKAGGATSQSVTTVRV